MDTNREQLKLFDIVNKYFGTVDGHPIKADTLPNKWPDRSLPNIFDEMGKLGLILCGGTINSIFTASKVNDLDFYMLDPNKEEECIQFLSAFLFNETFRSDNAGTYQRKSLYSNKRYTIQLITKFHGDPEKIFDNFDFTITHGCYNFKEQAFVFGPRFFPDLAARRLVYSGASKYPICAMYRTKKYQERGYKLSGATIMHIALSIVQLKIVNYAGLKDQLMGIDTMYLQNLLKEFNSENPVDYGEFISRAFKYLKIDGNTEAEEDDDAQTQ